ILSINPSITPAHMYDILTLSTDAIVLEYEADDPVNYVNHPDGIRQWNRFSGYGRLNAYEALKYTLENYGGTLTQNLHIPSGETWDFDSGVTITFDDNADMIVEGTVSGGTFDFVSPASNNGVKFPTGSTGSISDCTIINATRAIE